MPKDLPRQILDSILEKAIQEGKLFELIFTEEGRRLWKNVVTNEEEMRKLILKKLKRKKKSSSNLS